ncbi:Ger(x)C family spore germination protein [Paenibacillus dakarensis]|uniref:Ger(x)C family spore germination protein n=1 Tax=Paenibacillus dakarensis TaxID=1527293 RepID=UPI000AD9249B|nr:Ger(x)C family spore germination protein [Paenibacillus dakarensis]
MKQLKGLLMTLMCSSIIITGGCEFRDIDLRLFVVAIGVDIIPDQPELLRFNFKIAIPTGDPKSREGDVLIITEDSSNIAAAIRQAKSKVDKEFDFSHCKGVLYGEAYARKGIRKMQDWTIRRRDIQLLMHPAVAVPTAEAVLRVQPKSERITGSSLFLALSEEGTESPYITKVYSFDLARRIQEKGEDPILPVIEAANESLPDIKKVALMDKQKVKHILSPEETKWLNLLLYKDLRTNLGTNLDGYHYEMNATNTRSKFKIIDDGHGKGRIVYTIRIKGILEEKDEEEELSSRDLTRLEKEFDKSIAEDVLHLLTKVQATKLDPLGFGLRFFGTHWNNDSEVEQWKEMYPRIQFDVIVKTEIKSTGYTR